MGKKVPRKRKEAKISVEDVEDAMADESAIQRMKAKSKTFTGNLKDFEKDDADDLFTVDTKGSFDGISKTSRRELARAKLFPPKGPNLGLSWTEDAKIAKAERQVEARDRGGKEKAPETFDLWGAAPPKVRTNSVGGHNMRVRSAKPLNVKIPGTMHQKVGLAPAVLPAHEGQSMNPHRDAYEDLACMAAATQIELEREGEELDRKMRPMTHELRDAVGHEKLQQMSEEEKMHLYRKLHLKREADIREGEEGDAAEPHRARKRKSQALRNKQKKKVGLDAKEEQEKVQKRLDKSVGDVGAIKKRITEADVFHTNRKKYRETLREKRKEQEVTHGIVPKKRKLGGGRYQEEAAVVPDAAAIGGSSRATPLRASAARDRMQSVVRRGLLAPPTEATRAVKNWHKKKNNKLKNRKKFLSPLLKDNLLLR